MRRTNDPHYYSILTYVTLARKPQTTTAERLPPLKRGWCDWCAWCAWCAWWRLLVCLVCLCLVCLMA
jgi:hypothetical protein